MPAEITNIDGIAEMFYVGDTPWHGIGTRLNRPANAKEAIGASHLDWRIDTKPIYIKSSDSVKLIDNYVAITRVDTGEIFHIAKKRYTPLQNEDAFKFFDGVVGAGEAIYHTAGSLQKGRRVWILAKLNGELKVTNNEVLEKYILLANAHDGSLALTMTMTPVRVVCNNTLAVALKGARRGKAFYARHTLNVMNKVNYAKELLGLSEAYFANFMEGVNRLVAKQITEQEFLSILGEVYILRDGVSMEGQRKPKQVAIETTLELFENGRGNNDVYVRGSAWAAFNAVTEYIDYYAPIGRGFGGTLKTLASTDTAVVDRRLNSSWFGKSGDVRQQVFEKLLEFSKN